MKGITILRGQSIELDCATNPGIYVQTDGEFAGRLPARLEIVPRALTLLVPPWFRDKHLALNG